MLKYREETMKNVGLIGCGTISNQYLMNLSKSEDVKVIACADQFRDRAEALRKNTVFQRDAQWKNCCRMQKLRLF